MARTCLLSLLFLLLCGQAVFATDNYFYKVGEYAVVVGGRSPDGHWSIAAHGDGPEGYGKFDLYLIQEPAHRKVAALRASDCLDTGPLSIVAIWAPDSKHVAVLNRSDRHVLDLRLFAVADGKARSIPVPLLLEVMGRNYLKPGLRYETFSRLYRVEWLQSGRLIVEELDTLDSSQPVFGAGLKAYLTVNRLGAERTFTDFSALAEFEITAKQALRLASVKPLPLADWPKTITYTPHLRFDPERGLRNTETTVSSLDAQKRGN